MPDQKPYLPAIAVHEMMGVVAAMGSKISNDSLRCHLKEGDRMVYSYFSPCMRCYNCVSGDMGACKFQGRPPFSEWPVCNGGFSQYY